MQGTGKCSYYVQFNFLRKPELIKMIDWGLNVEGFLTPLKLIALVPVRLQTLNLESPAFLSKRCETADNCLQTIMEMGCKNSWQTAEQCHWGASPMHVFKASKSTAGLVRVWHPSCWSVLWPHSTVSTIRCFGNRLMTSVKAYRGKWGPIWCDGFWLWPPFSQIWTAKYDKYWDYIWVRTKVKTAVNDSQERMETTLPPVKFL